MIDALPFVAASVADVLRAGAIRPVYQPIVSLPDGEIVGYEALARGPRGSELERPDGLFAAARAEGLVAELDSACQRAALSAALASGLSRPLTLFINVEPEVRGPLSPELRALYARATERMQVAVEVTERALTAAPARLLARVAELREVGCLVALDDVGADDRSLAMMAFLAPDVIKLDMALVQRRPDAGVAEVVHAVGAEAERHGASLLVEGIEEGHQVGLSTAMGAVLGQGWHFGTPGQLPTLRTVAPEATQIPPARTLRSPATPFELITDPSATRTSTKPLLFEMSKHLERQAQRIGPTAVLMAAFQHDRFITPATRRRYASIAARGVFCAALAVSIDAEPAVGVRGSAFAPEDPLSGEWDVAVVSPHFAGALVARDMGDRGPDHERRFRYLVTYDRTLAVAAARALMARLVG